MRHKKGNQFTFFESLARLAYNKGTALFRGKDPLQRSAAETFSLIIKTSSQIHLTCLTWLRREWRHKQQKPLVYSTSPWINTSTRRGLFYRSRIRVISLYTDRSSHAVGVSLLPVSSVCYYAAELTELWIELQKITALSQKSRSWRWEVTQTILSALLSKSGYSLCGHHV